MRRPGRHGAPCTSEWRPLGTGMGKKTDGYINAIGKELADLSELHKLYFKYLDNYTDALNSSTGSVLSSVKHYENVVAQFQRGSVDEKAVKKALGALSGDKDETAKEQKRIETLRQQTEQIATRYGQKERAALFAVGGFEKFVKEKASSKKNPFKKVKIAATSGKFIKDVKKTIAEMHVELPQDMQPIEKLMDQHLADLKNMKFGMSNPKEQVKLSKEVKDKASKTKARVAQLGKFHKSIKESLKKRAKQKEAKEHLRILLDLKKQMSGEE